MKYAGMIILIISTTALGLLLSNNSKKKIVICRELKDFCDMLTLDLSYKITPATKLVDELLKRENINNLTFISKDNLLIKKEIISPLSNEENEQLSEFLFSLGKSDVKSQLQLIKNFKGFIKSSEEKYKEKHSKNSKLYIAFGVFSGVLVDLILL